MYCDGKERNSRVTRESEELLDAFAAKVELERKALGRKGKSLIMAVVRDDPIWKYGTLKY